MRQTDGLSALARRHWEAAENGHLEACKLHILNDKAVMCILVIKNLIVVHKSNSLQNSSSVTPIHIAAKSGHLFILIL